MAKASMITNGGRLFIVAGGRQFYLLMKISLLDPDEQDRRSRGYCIGGRRSMRIEQDANALSRRRDAEQSAPL